MPLLYFISKTHLLFQKDHIGHIGVIKCWEKVKFWNNGLKVFALDKKDLAQLNEAFNRDHR